MKRPSTSDRGLRFGAGFAAAAADIFRLLYLSIKAPLLEGRRGRRAARKVFLDQVYFTAAEALPLVILAAVVFGALLMTQASWVLPRYGLTQAEWVTAFVLLREITPLVTALIVIGRSANAITIELGNMQVNGEIRALETLAINVERFVVLPRLQAMVVSLVTLTAVFAASAFAGGYALARATGLLATDFVFERLAAAVTPELAGNILLRAFVFAVAIGAIATSYGLRVRAAATEVPRAASRAVLATLGVVFAMDFVLSIGIPAQ